MPLRAPTLASSSKSKKQSKKQPSSSSSKSTTRSSPANDNVPDNASKTPSATEKKSDRSCSNEEPAADTRTTKLKASNNNNNEQKKQQQVQYGSYSLADGPPWSSKDRFLANALAKAAAKRQIKLPMTEAKQNDGNAVPATGSTGGDPNWGYPSNGNTCSADADSKSIAGSFSVPPMKNEQVPKRDDTPSPLADVETDLKDDTELTFCTSQPKESDVIHASPNGSGCPFLHHQKIHLEQLETGDTIAVQPSETTDAKKPRHAVGCTPHECHGAMMDKTGFAAVGDSYSQPIQTKIDDAVAFIRQFAEETSHFATPQDLEGRLFDVTNDIQAYGTYRHTHEELKFGCRLAWRNSGRCIMRKVSFNLELRDCRNAKTSKECFDQIIDHLHYAGNDGAIKPVISVFPQKGDGVSAPVRVWNRQLIGYAAYQRKDGSIMGDPVNLSFTALCVKLGWTPPSTKSDFDVLPLILSDNIIGHDRPQVFEIPTDAILEVPIHHPEHELFSSLNLRWYALPAISNMGIDIGGVYYQTCPFNGWYQVTEIGRDFLDKQRYDLAEAVAIACGIQRSKVAVWRDDVQLQVHKAILHSFAKASVSLVDHHTASDSFIDFHKEEIGKRGKCPADWVWVTPPAGGSMTKVFHQEMVNFIVKPIYRPNVDICLEAGLNNIDPFVLDEECTSKSSFTIDTKAVIYDKIVLCFGSETGTSQRFITRLATDLNVLGDRVVGPIPLDDLPNHIPTPRCRERTLILAAASTTGLGGAPSHAKLFLPRLENMMSQSGTLHTTSFGVLALGNSAYTQSFAKFGVDVHEALDSIGIMPVLNVRVADELMDQELSFDEWRGDILNDSSGIIYQEITNAMTSTTKSTDTVQSRKVTLSYQGFAQVIQSDTKNELEQLYNQFEHTPWSRVQGLLGRSIDLFCFEVDIEHRSQLKDLRPGDHVALYPRNLDESVDLTLRMLDGVDSSMREVRDSLKQEVDLARPVSTAALAELWNATTNEKAKYVIGSILRTSTKNETDKSVTDLINELPPGSIPYHWMLMSAPKMDPRFYSIASISMEDSTISICQSVYAFANGQAGTTSRWLRSLQADETATAVFSQTDLHLPTDEDAPCIMIATGTGIAPFRSFWMSNARNPMHLFFGCRTRSDLPFASEIGFLERTGRINPCIAYSREMNNKMHVQDMLDRESETILSLLHNSKTHLYICGSPDMASTVQNRLLMILCTGSNKQQGMKINQAMEKLVIMKQQKRYITEVYGALSTGDDAMQFAWKEATARVVEITSGLERVVLPRARAKEEFKAIRPTKKSSWAEQFRPECVTQLDSEERLDIASSTISTSTAGGRGRNGSKKQTPVTDTGKRIARGESSAGSIMSSRRNSAGSLPSIEENKSHHGTRQRSASHSPTPIVPTRPRLQKRDSWMGSFAFHENDGEDLSKSVHGRDGSSRSVGSYDLSRTFHGHERSSRSLGRLGL